MIVTVKAFAGFRDVMPKEVPIELPDGSTIFVLLNVIEELYPGLEAMGFSSPGGSF